MEAIITQQNIKNLLACASSSGKQPVLEWIYVSGCTAYATNGHRAYSCTVKADPAKAGFVKAKDLKPFLKGKKDVAKECIIPLVAAIPGNLHYPNVELIMNYKVLPSDYAKVPGAWVDRFCDSFKPSFQSCSFQFTEDGWISTLYLEGEHTVGRKTIVPLLDAEAVKPIIGCSGGYQCQYMNDIVFFWDQVAINDGGFIRLWNTKLNQKLLIASVVPPPDTKIARDRLYALKHFRK